ncbi:MAG: glycosyltransferase family 2 protein [Verrucomicrobia bacterium]|nr:glycosyltransferase family 2 protein [Verrucomicrobiota bacterium]
MPTTHLQPRVAVIVLNYNSWQETVQCLESLRATTYSRWQAIVVDNGSTNDSVRQIQAWAARAGWPVADAVSSEESGSPRPLVLLPAGRNLGYTGGNNAGIRHALHAGFDLVLVLNNDTTVDREFLNVLVEFACEHPRAGMVGPCIYEADRPQTIQSAGARIHWWKAKFPPLSGGITGAELGETPRMVDYISGAAILVRRETIERIGVLDEAFYLYVEEVDWCRRSAVAGYGIWVVPRSRIWHQGAASAKRAPQPSVEYYRFRNRIFFMRKHARWYHWLVFGPYLLRHVLGKSIGYLAAGRREHCLALWRALRDGLCQKLSPVTTRL